MLRDIPFRLRQNRFAKRDGLSILEVMVSIGILVLGLLGVVALIPIAAQKLRQGIALDDATAVARAGMADLQARDGTNSQKWLRYQPGAFAAPTPTLSNLWGVQSQLDPYPPANNTLSAYVHPTWPICIDPMMYESALIQNMTDRQPNFFPYQPQAPAGGVFPASTEMRGGMQSSSFGRMVRVTMNWNAVDWRQAFNSAQLTPATLNVGLANSMCVSTDDLLLNSPGQEPSEGMLGVTVSQSDLPASQHDVSMQSWDDPSATRLKRNADSRISWFATLVPSPGSIVGESNSYDLSVAVVERRDLVVDASRATTIDSATEQLQQVESERTAGVRFLGGGLGGGEIDLISYIPPSNANDIELAKKSLSRIREGNWILISGPSGPLPPIGPPGGLGHIYYWYRIGSIDPEAAVTVHPTTGANEVTRKATIRGADWPSGPSGNSYVPIVVGTQPYAYGEATIISNVINVVGPIQIRGQ